MNKEHYDSTKKTSSSLREPTKFIMSSDSPSDPEADTDILFSFVNRILNSITSRTTMATSSPTSPTQLMSPTPTPTPTLPPRPPKPNASTLHHCGQFTFYFPRCQHATSHLFHLNTWSGIKCNKNCVYDQNNNFWFYADEGSHCSYCGLGDSNGIGVKQAIPEEGGMDRERFFDGLVRGGKMGREGHEELFSRAVGQYNVFIDGFESGLGDKDKEKGKGKNVGLRSKRKGRMLDRWEVRKMRAKRRTEEWVGNIRAEQYSSTKSHKEVGERPYIVTPTGNPHMDLYTEVSLPLLPTPIDNCAWCQFSLASPEAILESGPPSSLPCGHTFHYNCIVELFEKRIKAQEKEKHKCPLCSTWFRDVREIPDFYGRYKGAEHAFDSSDESSVLSGSDVGDLRGHPGPPWMETLSIQTRKEDGEGTVATSETATLDHVDIVEETSNVTEEIDAEVEHLGENLEEGSISEQPPATSDSGHANRPTQEQQDSLHLNCDEPERADAIGEDQQSYVITLRIPSGVARHSSRRRRQPRRLVNESGWGGRRRGSRRRLQD